MKYVFLLMLLLGSLLPAETNATYVGDHSCAECHVKEVKDWEGSHHDMAMKKPTEETVVGDFNNATFELHGITSHFYKKGERFVIRTDGEDGELHDYEVAYTFGIYPLQQYLVKFPDGKYQIPDIAWDSRSESEGGQRWFHIHQDEVIRAGDPLHWTGINFNWNFMCADCHSTHLQKNYDPKTKRYHTTWESINVSCEACHGPASRHLDWAKHREENLTHHGFAISLSHKGRKWFIDEKTFKPKLLDGNLSVRDREVGVCAQCHARRSQLDDDYSPGDPFRDHYLPAQLTKGLYFADGKIQDEVYVYDSFLQSAMYAKGVTCSDCHDPHTLHRKREGDKVCYQCHERHRYESTAHHHHQTGSEGASCIACHMPARTYMGVDSRNDHSFRLPRPDLSVAMPEIPNACNLCHKERNATWATEAMKRWYGTIPVGHQQFAHPMHSLRENLADALRGLYDVLASDAPDIAKATVAKYLGNYPSKQTYTTTLQLLQSSDGTIRLSALRALEHFPPKIRIEETFRMLDDPLKTVRTEAARQLSAFSVGHLDDRRRALLKRVIAEYEKSLLFNADRPESQLALAQLYRNRKMLQKAEEAHKEALRLQPLFVPAIVNYSDFLKQTGREAEAYDILQKGLKALPNVAALYYSLGLWYVRNKEKQKALEELRRAVALDRDDARFAYVYAVALGEKDPRKAIEVLEAIYPRHTGDQSIIGALVYYYRQVGDLAKSQAYEKRLKGYRLSI
jgi:tetratricopeptide (TPR) repeat protein